MERLKCSLGCPILDNLLNGGVPCGSVTELVGESSAAKTQLCLQLSLTVQLPIADGGLEGAALYIHTENYFASSRLRQLATPHSVAARARRRHPLADIPTNSHPFASNNGQFGKSLVDDGTRPSSVRASYKQSLRETGNCHTNGVYHPAKVSANSPTGRRFATSRDAGDPCKNVYVQGLQTAEELLRYLDHAEMLLQRPLQMSVRLIIIDSIAALFKGEFDNKMAAMTGRGTLFFQISSKLKRMAEKYDLAVVISNHVTDYFEPIEAPRRDPTPGSSPHSATSDILMTSNRRVVPALGISWSQCVNTRLFLSRVNYGPNTIRRSIRVVFAPHLPNVSCHFVVETEGVKGMSPEQTFEDKENYACQYSSSIASSYDSAYGVRPIGLR
jgi:DNA-repair protein XRCC3